MEAEATGVKVEDRRGTSQEAIQNLVGCRNNVLTLLSEIASQQPLQNVTDSRDLVCDFCEALIDYTATAHFQLYRFIDNHKERRKAVNDVAGAIYPDIMKSTQSILDFNDRYEAENENWDFGALSSDVSSLAEALADRIELEDKLIQVLTSKR